MRKTISILGKDYKQWVKSFVVRHHQSQIKESFEVNTEQLMYNFMLGRDIVEMHVEERWGESVIKLQFSHVEGKLNECCNNYASDDCTITPKRNCAIANYTI
ncbi:MAG: hypothetical protein IJV44_09550 [Prevotella sp.]|nr:hypothetical protein [Prevotella sp.]